ncbi:MAG: glycosyltransferase [Bacteroidota bacterium]
MNNRQDTATTNGTLVLFCPTKGWGGIEKNVRLRAEYFGKQGHQVYVVLLQNQFRERFDGLENVHIKNVNTRGGDLNLMVIMRYVRFLKQVKPHTVFSPLKRDWWLVTVSAYLSGVPNTVLYLGNRRKVRKGLKYHTVFNTLKAKMIVNCQALKRHLTTTTNYFNDSNLFQIYTGIPLPELHGEKMHFRGLLGLEKDAFVIGVVGWINYRKGFDQLPDIARELPDNYHFVHAGTGGFDLDADQLMKDNDDVSHRIHWLGHQSNMDAFFRGIDVFLLCSRSESLANVLNETMGHGKPIVSTRAPGSDELLGDGEYGILTPVEDVTAMAKGILDIATGKVVFDPKKQRKRMKDHFSLDQMMQGYASVFFPES